LRLHHRVGLVLAERRIRQADSGNEIFHDRQPAFDARRANTPLAVGSHVWSLVRRSGCYRGRRSLDHARCAELLEPAAGGASS
jgi:hypothetical protein